MLLGCPAESLPAQHEFTAREDYGRALRVYLDKHHGMTYVEMGAAAFSALPGALRSFHVLIGESPRTSPDNDTWHAIVGCNGEAFWDVNPSRAGLTKIGGYGVLVPTPSDWRASWQHAECVCGECQRVRKAEAA